MRWSTTSMYLKVPLWATSSSRPTSTTPATRWAGAHRPARPGHDVRRAGEGLQEATYVGSDDVDGESLDHYAVRGPGDARRDGLPSTEPTMAEDPDYRRLVRRGRLRPAAAPSTLGPLGTVELTLSDWGEDVSIEAPPADQVTRFRAAG